MSRDAGRLRVRKAASSCHRLRGCGRRFRLRRAGSPLRRPDRSIPARASTGRKAATTPDAASVAEGGPEIARRLPRVTSETPSWRSTRSRLIALAVQHGRSRSSSNSSGPAPLRVRDDGLEPSAVMTRPSPRGCWPAPAINTGTMSPTPRLWRSGERSANRGCGRRAARVPPGFRAIPAAPGRRSPVEFVLLPRQQRLQQASRSALDRIGHSTGADAAGVPGRGEYLNENAWANPVSPTRSRVARSLRRFRRENRRSDRSTAPGRAAPRATRDNAGLGSL